MSKISAKIFSHNYTGSFSKGIVFENSITVNVSIFDNGTYSHTVTARRKFVDDGGKMVAVEFDMPSINVTEFENVINTIQNTDKYLNLNDDRSVENLPIFELERR